MEINPISSKEIEAFEAWFTNRFYAGDTECAGKWLYKEPCGHYRHAHPVQLWEVWQARASMPIYIDLPHLGMWSLDRDMVIEAIERAGMKVFSSSSAVVVPAELLKIICANWENGEDVTGYRANAIAELRALLGKEGE